MFLCAIYGKEQEDRIQTRTYTYYQSEVYQNIYLLKKRVVYNLIIGGSLNPSRILVIILLIVVIVIIVPKGNRFLKCVWKVIKFPYRINPIHVINELHTISIYIYLP